MVADSKKPPRASVVIPNWNGRHFIGACLDSLRVQTFKDFEVIVVENGSVDGSLEFIQENYPEVTILAQPKNLGFAGGVNQGIRRSRAKYVALFNNDAIADKNWLTELVNVLESDKNIAAVTSKILQLKNSKDRVNIDSTGDFMTIWGIPFPRGRDEVDQGQYDTVEEVFGACGGSVLYRRSLFDEIGFFDEDFFAYYEDVDISFRARLAGYKIFYQPKSIVYHKVGGTSGGGATPFTRFHSVKNTFYLYFKNMPAVLFFKYLPRFTVSEGLLLLASIKHDHLLWSHIKSLAVGIFYLPKTLIKRYRIQCSSHVRAREIDRLLYRDFPPLQKKGLVKKFAWLKKLKQA